MTPASPAGARRGRPRSTGTASPLAPREEILQHAAALFSAKGVGATRLSDIAASVGISAPALYYHFESLDAIVGALLDYVVNESAAYATAAADREGPGAERLASLVRQHIERLTTGPYDLWFVAGLTRADSQRFAQVGRKAEQWRKAVARLVRTGVANGEFGPVEVDLAVAAVSGLVYGAMRLRHDGGEVAADDVARLAVGSLTAYRPAGSANGLSRSSHGAAGRPAGSPSARRRPG